MNIERNIVILFLIMILCLFLLASFLITTECKASEIHTYDENGVWNGSIDDYGNQYDRNGTYKGIVDVMGNIYNRNGTWEGYIEFDKETGPRPVYIIPNE